MGFGSFSLVAEEEGGTGDWQVGAYGACGSSAIIQIVINLNRVDHVNSE